MLSLSRKCLRLLITVTLSSMLVVLMMMTSRSRNTIHVRLPSLLPVERWTSPAKLGDVYFSVKTTKAYHRTRIPILLDTWVAPVLNQTYFFSDGAPDANLTKRIADGHFINTGCHASHNKFDLCCKMAAEFTFYLSTPYLWFCHVDDDMYVHLTNLMDWLQQYDVNKQWYLGRLSWPNRFDLPKMKTPNKGVWFATGALLCISRPLALEMQPHMVKGAFVKNCKKTGVADDVALAYITEILVGATLTTTTDIHSHLEELSNLTATELDRALTISYAEPLKNPKKPSKNKKKPPLPEPAQGGAVYNRINITGLPVANDKTRFYSYHCRIHKQAACTNNTTIHLPDRRLGRSHEMVQTKLDSVHIFVKSAK